MFALTEASTKFQDQGRPAEHVVRAVTARLAQHVVCESYKQPYILTTCANLTHHGCHQVTDRVSGQNAGARGVV